MVDWNSIRNNVSNFFSGTNPALLGMALGNPAMGVPALIGYKTPEFLKSLGQGTTSDSARSSSLSPVPYADKFAYPNGPLKSAIARRAGVTSPINEDAPGLAEWMSSQGLDPNMLSSMMSQIQGSSVPTPVDMTGQWVGAAGSVYNPVINQLKAGIPRMKQEGRVAKAETRDLYNIAEKSFKQGAKEVSKQGKADAKEQADVVGKLVAQMDAADDTQQQDYVAGLEELGYGDAAQTGALEIGDEYSNAIGTKGALSSNRIAETTSNAANTLSQIAALQDAEAAAQVTDISNQVADLIFQQRGRIADAQSQRAAAQLDAMMRARADFMAQQEMSFDMQRSNRSDLLGILGMQMDLGERYTGFVDQWNQTPEVELTEEQQRFNAINDFAERAKGYTPERAQQQTQKAVSWAMQNWSNIQRAADMGFDPFASATQSGVDPELAMYAAQMLGYL